MKRTSKRTNDRGVEFIWPGVRWRITLDLDSRMNVRTVTAMAMRGEGDTQQLGHAHKHVGPFDDVIDAINTLAVDAAVNLSDQLTLWHEDGTAPGPD